MKLKTGMVAFLAAAGLLMLTSTLQAQTNTPPGGRRAGRGMSVEQRVDRLSEQLKLTDAQKPKVKALLEEENTKTRELRRDTALSRQERNTKMRSLREESNKKMKEILSAEQFKKYEEMEAQRAQQRGRRNQNRNGAGGGGN